MNATITRLMLSLGFCLGLGSKTVWASELNCAKARSVVNGALTLHVTEHELTPALTSRWTKHFAERLQVYKGYLSDEAIQSLATQLAKPLDVKNPCPYFEEASKVVTYEMNELVKSYEGKSVYELENNALAEALVSWKEFALPEVTKEFIGSSELRKIRNAAALRSNFAYVQMLKSFMRALDPHSSFATVEEAQTFEDEMSPAMVGVGIVIDALTPLGLRIADMYQQGPAAESKEIKVGDIVSAIDGFSTADMGVEQAQKLLKGKAESKVYLQVGTPDHNGSLENVHDVELTRTELHHDVVRISATREQHNGKSIGVLKLVDFYRNSAKDLYNAYLHLKASGELDALVLDLRGNPGGVLQEAVLIAGLFIGEGEVASISKSTGKFQALQSPFSEMLISEPLVVMVNQTSASASELVAGAIADYGRGIIVGSSHTFGKGTYQTVVPLTGENDQPIGSMGITGGLFFTPSGETTQLVGVSSDIQIPGPDESKGMTEAKKPGAIAKLDRELGNPFMRTLYSKATGLADLLPVLKAQSEARTLEIKVTTAELQQQEAIQVAADFAEEIDRVIEQQSSAE